VTFEQFAAERLRALLRFATTLTSDRGLGEDLVQDVLLRTHARWDRIGQLDEPYAYVRKMLVNEFLSWRRKWARIVPHADLPETASRADHAARHADRDAMQHAIEGLPRRQRAVIVLRYYEDLSDDDIAAVLGCTRSTVRGHAMRALRALRVQQAAPLAPELGSRG
jgi:RNA polymerase sigma-70 factor (sigma-E family)